MPPSVTVSSSTRTAAHAGRVISDPSGHGAWSAAGDADTWLVGDPRALDSRRFRELAATVRLQPWVAGRKGWTAAAGMNSAAVLLVAVDADTDIADTAWNSLRSAFPAARWVACADLPEAVLVDLFLALDFRGVVPPDVAPALWQRARTAVLRGELWFPRAVMQALAERQRMAMAPAAPNLIPDNAAPDDGLEALSPREQQVLTHVRQGLTNKAIAQALNISPNTVKKHLARAFEKRGIKSRRQLLG